MSARTADRDEVEQYHSRLRLEKLRLFQIG